MTSYLFNDLFLNIRKGATAKIGDSGILLKESVSWPIGSQIVIATTGDKFSVGQSETATILDTNGTYLKLDKPLMFEHLSISRQVKLGDPLRLPIEAEVGLLSKNIVFQGSVDQSWAEFGSDQFGAIISVR